jgi:hypothetical protein
VVQERRDRLLAGRRLPHGHLQAGYGLENAGFFERLCGVQPDHDDLALYVKNARTPLDFDGKGMSDYSVFFPGAGWLYNLYSEAMNYIVLDWSDPDIPVPADYNGDGYTDIAFFYPGRGYWVILNGDGTQRSSGEYGWNGVIPVRRIMTAMALRTWRSMIR